MPATKELTNTHVLFVFAGSLTVFRVQFFVLVAVTRPAQGCRAT